MKIRNSFVSNSSASSFVISKHDLSQNQLLMIKNHGEESRRMIAERGLKTEQTSYGEICESLFYSLDEPWFILEDENFIFGYTSMTNFNMDQFLNEIGVPENNINWDDGYVWDTDDLPKIHEKFIGKKNIELRILKLKELEDGKE